MIVDGPGGSLQMVNEEGLPAWLDDSTAPTGLVHVPQQLDPCGTLMVNGKQTVV